MEYMFRGWGEEREAGGRRKQTREKGADLVDVKIGVSGEDFLTSP